MVHRAARPDPDAARIFQDYQDDKAAIGKPTKRDREAWVALAPHFAHLRPDRITRAVCRAYAKSRRAAGVRDSTVNKELRTLRAAVNWYDRHSSAVFEIPSGRPAVKRYLTRGEYRALRRAALAGGAFHAYLFMVLAIATCGRPSAILQLTWDRVDFTRGLIALGDARDHGRKGRATVPMTRLARAALHRAKRAALTDHAIEWAGKPVANVKRAIENAYRRAGIPKVTANAFRRSAARWLAEEGRPMAEIAQYMGHTDSRITEREYARFSPEYLAGTANALERAMRARREPMFTPGTVRKRAGFAAGAG
jgi:integrase